ncbi:histidine kinase [Pseudoalteromonas fuliginea]|uniref:histidine kinase n=1 Tax=Pseudoalteromonas fuliginea TaxID=1872678 RepID=A0AB73BC15_9GAMM|nr:sensor histidine kinase [Pseudoalteromonas fuliginea]KAA1156829.1 histidine kinase [Pseudoalteromonas fuliginea]
MSKQKQQGKANVTWAAFIVVVLSIIVGNAFLALNTIQGLTQTQKSLDNTSMLTTAIEQLHLSIVQAESGQRGYLLTEEDDYLTPYYDAIGQLEAQTNHVKSLRSEIDGQAERIAELLLLVERKIRELKKTVNLALDDKERRALNIVNTHNGRDLYKQIREHINEIQDRELLFKVSHFSKLAKIKNEAKITFAITAITSALLIIGMFIMTRLNLRNAAQYRLELENQNETLAVKVSERTQELTLYSDELSRSNRELEEFAFVASHDLQEPLRKIQAFSDRLETMFKDELGEKGMDYIGRMKNAAQRMSNLINDLLEFSRITTRGKDFADTNLNEVVSDILSDLEIAIKESNARVDVEDLPVIQADKSQMQQLFLNLLSNAVKFRHPDVSPHIKISYVHEDIFSADHNTHLSFQVITIKDNGIGFSQDYADKIFVPFQRLHGRSQYKGTGIGLSVCRRIVERHGGTITAQSKDGEGATFVIKLPVEAALFTLQGEA